MVRPYLPLNAFRAFEASARHLSFTKAAIELNVTQAAVSHQVIALEAQLGVTLFRRLPRGLMITAEGDSLLPVLRDSFDRMADAVERLRDGHVREVLTVGAVGTFAVGWLLPRLPSFQERYPYVDLRLSTNNNRVDLAAEGLDLAIRFGGGAWHATEATRLFEAPLSVLCRPDLAEGLKRPEDLMGETLLRSYRPDEWTRWFEAAGVSHPGPMQKSIVFDTSLAMMEAIQQGIGVGLAPPKMFERQLTSGLVAQPFAITVSMGSYWLTRLHSRPVTPAMEAFSTWMTSMIEQSDEAGC
ncbi:MULTISPECIES: LysR family transcriptional regulator [unclassified Rhizobium]|uniref:LysR family transcriptional regulator n=1 Tax=unclassified Rhizobium TaxID=2613769 RepID=UPI001ADCB483|nr:MULTISPECIES: LysR family transcriptional regulator [unclassified Rhizobium]MBO9124910.1 LysR family transcriptional regulator [Rhizobium sp. 16-488-2b]MBO9175495.1 LysR family transcriptional regulator [Rhizobium sp. 16-488-2a]